MLSVGRLCIKTSGREAGRKCAVVKVIDDTSVLIDGNVQEKAVQRKASGAVKP